MKFPLLVNELVGWYLWKSKVKLVNEQYRSLFESQWFYSHHESYDYLINRHMKLDCYRAICFNWREYDGNHDEYSYLANEKGLMVRSAHDLRKFVRNRKKIPGTNTSHQIRKIVYTNNKKDPINFVSTNAKVPACYFFSSPNLLNTEPKRANAKMRSKPT